MPYISMLYSANIKTLASRRDDLSLGSFWILHGFPLAFIVSSQLQENSQ